MEKQQCLTADRRHSEVGVDWLTLTTYSLEAFNELYYIHTGEHDQTGIKEKGAFRNYRGVVAAGALWASGKQGQAIHYLVKASGARAHDLAVSLASCLSWESFRSSRVDLQVTVPGTLDGLSVKRSAESIVATRRMGRPPKITAILGDTDTVYIGSRSSERMVRIYQKLGTPDGIPPRVRFEVELKGDLAATALKDMMNGRVRIADRLAWEWNRLPVDRNHESLSGITNELLACKSAEPTPPPIRPLPNTLRWLETVVDSSVKKLASDHDCHQPVLELLYSWLSLYSEGVEG